MNLYCRGLYQRKTVQKMKCHPQGEISRNSGGADTYKWNIMQLSKKLQSVCTYQHSKISMAHDNSESQKGATVRKKAVTGAPPGRAGRGREPVSACARQKREERTECWRATHQGMGLSHRACITLSLAFFKGLKTTSGRGFGCLRHREDKVHLLSHSSVPG